MNILDNFRLRLTKKSKKERKDNDTKKNPNIVSKDKSKRRLKNDCFFCIS